MIGIVIAALLMAVASISGMVTLGIALLAEQSTNSVMRTVASRNELKAQYAEAQLARAREQLPRYGRDPATGRFVKRS